ncbi:hypothetical protein CHS0354_031677 [Potamilus streckersoni]|uniref:Uncharacterized protein n=1 Tax=Potamilus streckersoni TaxID=2493646 RepID=A0AAE0SRP9_9BIVA|nr:hypothetical protein CHS0354_031677 [Potamilus streckersoni]
MTYERQIKATKGFKINFEPSTCPTTSTTTITTTRSFKHIYAVTDFTKDKQEANQTTPKHGTNSTTLTQKLPQHPTTDHTVTTGEATPTISTMYLTQDRGKHIGRCLTTAALPQQPNETEQYDHNKNNLAHSDNRGGNPHNIHHNVHQIKNIDNSHQLLKSTTVKNQGPPDYTVRKKYHKYYKLYATNTIKKPNNQTQTNISQEKEPTTFLDYEDHPTTSKGKRLLKGQARTKRTKASTPDLQFNTKPTSSSFKQRTNTTTAQHKHKPKKEIDHHHTAPNKHKKLKNKEIIKLKSMPSQTAQVHNTYTLILHTDASPRVKINKSPALNTITPNNRQPTGYTNTNF